MRTVLVILVAIALSGCATQPTVEGTHTVFYAKIDRVESRISEIQTEMESVRRSNPKFGKTYILGSNYNIHPKILYLREELWVYQKMKSLLLQGMPGEASPDFKNSLGMIGKYEFIETQRRYQRAVDELRKKEAEKKSRVIKMDL